MAGITIRNLDDGIERPLRLRAARHGPSVEEEVRHIPCQAVGQAPAPANLGESIHRRFASIGGVELDLPPREAMPEAPRFDEPSVKGVREAVSKAPAARWRAENASALRSSNAYVDERGLPLEHCRRF